MIAVFSHVEYMPLSRDTATTSARPVTAQKPQSPKPPPKRHGMPARPQRCQPVRPSLLVQRTSWIMNYDHTLQLAPPRYHCCMSQQIANEMLLHAIVDHDGAFCDVTGKPLAALPPGTEVEVRVRSSMPAPSSKLHQLMLAGILSATGLIAILAVLGANWSWTGFSGHETLWDWISLLVFPLAIASFPVRIAMGGRPLGGPWRLTLLALTAIFALLTVDGYGFGWAWTGFPGKSLWDWLHLLLFPVVLVFLPDWFQKGTPFGRTGAIATAILFPAFFLVVLGGYYGRWSWTGFTGNTFRAWLDLLIAPFLLPAACRWFHTHWARRAEMGQL
jgi:hypothetical protein